MLFMRQAAAVLLWSNDTDRRCLLSSRFRRGGMANDDLLCYNLRCRGGIPACGSGSVNQQCRGGVVDCNGSIFSLVCFIVMSGLYDSERKLYDGDAFGCPYPPWRCRLTAMLYPRGVAFLAKAMLQLEQRR